MKTVALTIAVLMILILGSGVQAGTTVVDNNGDAGVFGTMALDQDDNPVIAYKETGTGILRLLRCTDPMCQDAEIVVIANTGFATNEQLSLVIDVNNLAALTYYDANTDTLQLARCGNIACTTVTITTVDATPAAGLKSSLVLTNNDLPVIGYYDANNDVVLIARCADRFCEDATLSTIEGVASLGGYVSLRLDGTLPVIAYTTSDVLGFRLLRCNNAACSSATVTAIDTTNLITQRISMRLINGNTPIVAYYNSTDTDLHLAICDNATCSASSLVVIDNVGNVGQYPSLAMDDDGFPVIGYNDLNTGALIIARCSDANCNGISRTVVDDQGTTGQYIGLALDDNDNPVISYYESLGGELRLYTPPQLFTNELLTTAPGATSAVDQTLLESIDRNPIVSSASVSTTTVQLVNTVNPITPTSQTVSNTPASFNRSAAPVSFPLNPAPVLTYTVLAGPDEGTLSLAPTFLEADISGGNLSYTADPSTTATTDSFRFTVTDGLSTIGPFTFNIQIAQPQLPTSVPGSSDNDDDDDESASVSVSPAAPTPLQPTLLPETGETPLWASAIRYGLVVFGSLGILSILYRLKRRGR